MNAASVRFVVAVVVLATLPMVAMAQEAPEEEAGSAWSWSLSATTDYRFRGLSQTGVDPAFQAGLTYSAPFGLYVGTWASNVDFGEGDPDHEVDAFIGYNADLTDWANLDVMINRYNYPGAGALNYNELLTKVTFLENYSLLVGYTDNVFNSDTDGWYYQAAASYPLPRDFSVGASVGKSEFEDGTVGRDYMDWSVSIGKSFGPLTLTAAYIGTDGDGRDAYGEIADDKVVISATVAN